MPTIQPKFVLPTGYETEQLKAARKRKIAEALIQKGLQTNPNMQSWAQVLGQIGTAFIGKRMDKKADALDADVRSRMLSDYATRSAAFDKLTGSANPDLSSIVRTGQDDPFLQERVKPYVDAFAKRLSERENIVRTPTTFARQGDLIGKPTFDPQAMMVPTGKPGEYGVNAARVTAALAAQPNTTISNAQTTIQDPSTMPQQTPNTAPQAMPSGLDLGMLSPEEKQILSSELQRRAGGGGQYQLQTDTSTPMGSPLTAQKAPEGVTVDGRPYWLVNGIPYDNPEGR